MLYFQAQNKSLGKRYIDIIEDNTPYDSRSSEEIIASMKDHLSNLEDNQ